MWRLHRTKAVYDRGFRTATGTAKDLLEAVAKFVREEVGMPVSGSPSLKDVGHLARDRLGVLSSRRDASGAKQIREIHQSTWKIGQQVNELRALQGTGQTRSPFGSRVIPVVQRSDLHKAPTIERRRPLPSEGRIYSCRH